MRRRTFSKILVPAVALALIATPAMAAKKKPVKIGLLYALSGLAAVYTKGTVIGHQIAAEEINAAGGVLGGRKIKFVTRDNKLKPGIAVKEFRRMVTRDKVDFVMGVISSGIALAVSQVAKEMKVLFVDTIAQTAALTGEQGHNYVIRTNTNSTVIGRTAALAASRQAWKKYYFIGPDYEWGHRVNADFWDFLRVKKAGVEKLGDLWPKLGERDYSAHITAMLNAKPDAVFSSLWGGDLIAFIKQASAYGFFDKIQYISTGGGDLDLLKPLGDDMPDGVLATYLYAFDTSPVKQAENKEFIAEFKKRAGYLPKSGDIIGYVSTYMLAEAMNKAGSAKSEDIVKAMRGSKFSTILGDIEVRKIDGQATFAYHAGFTYKNPKYPFKRLKDVTRAEGLEVLRTDAEVIKARADYMKKGS
ncbi:MAG: ABC transporter substrate-binding protein [Rhodospirillaceae bacterium]|jgi:branched-chain amino acid transport system substrate-binding protein|nr:ABC transporter substrate-binding protein [Rhodospirillaceae bacterium]MBT5195481.1 ABC transporter substrate-binding protein [Rhodospirillaceae bacterium]MBT5897990.1 ABC transporter substrate-binding protein [Rhodospirillaceae bacterium]MBT6429372.1 ABC transporter substrate-binding protein [Rhodospirillaceae bacterium]MBT7758462.1 ABC transporter substrate-binding protein [Rhodospirillaceae bacterium]